MGLGEPFLKTLVQSFHNELEIISQWGRIVYDYAHAQIWLQRNTENGENILSEHMTQSQIYCLLEIQGNMCPSF